MLDNKDVQTVCLKATMIAFVILICIQMQPVVSFDLNSAISQLTNIQGISLSELKRFASPAILQKLFGSKGNMPAIPSLESLTRGDPTQLAKILSKLKPSQGRFEPELEEILANVFRMGQNGHGQRHPSYPGPAPPPQMVTSPYFQSMSKSTSASAVAEGDEEEFEDEESAENSVTVKRGVYQPPNPDESSTKYSQPQPSLITRHGVKQFSSKFRNRNGNRNGYRPTDEKSEFGDGIGSTTPMTSPNQIPNRPEFHINHITDPNIRNHRLIFNDQVQVPMERNNYENFTVIDRNEDLMMDESETHLISLGAGSGYPATSTSGWVGVSPERESGFNQDRKSEDEAIQLVREPLKRPDVDEEVHSVNTENYFRPSPADTNGPKFIDPGQDFFTSTIRNPNRDSEEDVHALNMRTRGPFVMPEFPKHRKSDRILKQNYDQQFLANFPPPNKYPNQKPAANTFPHFPVQQIPPNNFHQQQLSNFGHPFAHYGFNHKFKTPMKNKLSFISESENGEQQTEASDKVDSSWTSTLFLLGGVVAASAVMAFVLPGILGTVGVVGKDNISGDDDLSSDRDFWSEVKGLYNDLVNIGRGDYSHFNRNDGIEILPSSTEKIDKTGEFDTTMEYLNSESTERHFSNGKGKFKERNQVETTNYTDATLAFPVNSGNVNTDFGIFQNSNFSNNRVHNNTFLREWAKVQLHLIEN